MLAYLFVLDAIFENVLHHQAPRLTQGNFMPYPSQCIIHLGQDLGRLFSPSKLEKLLPNMAGIAVNHRFWDSAEEFVYHDSLLILRDTIKRLLDDVASKRVHAQVEGVTSDRTRDGNDLIGCSMLEATLDEEVSKAIYHQRVCLADDCLDDIKLLVGCADFQLLLQENGCLLIVVAYNLVHDVFPIAGDIFVEKASIIERFKGRNIRLHGAATNALEELFSTYPVPCIVFTRSVSPKDLSTRDHSRYQW